MTPSSLSRMKERAEAYKGSAKTRRGAFPTTSNASAKTLVTLSSGDEVDELIAAAADIVEVTATVAVLDNNNNNKSQS